MKKRIVYFSLTFLCFIACYIIVKLFNENRFIRGFTGDIIVILLIYFFIKLFHDFNSFKLAIFTLSVAFSTEILQYFKLAALLGLEHSKIAQLILGSVFDPYDLLAYTIGAVIVYFIDTKIVKSLF